MVVRRWLTVVAVAATLAAPTSAWASGPSPIAPWYVDQYGGDPADAAAFFKGRTGIVMPTAPRAMLYISWRLLHGQNVGQVAGQALATPCCGTPWWAHDWGGGANKWSEARKVVPGVPQSLYIETERPSAEGSYSQVCFDDAFDTAAATLKDRAAKHGAASPEVRAWLAGQDAVFANCHKTTALPPLPASAPSWLKADRAYQEAAAAFYDTRYAEAARRFSDIAKDAGSPWRGTGVYLVARALTRKALMEKTPAGYAEAHAAVARLEAASPTTYGWSQVLGLRNLLGFHEDAKAFAVGLQQRLSARQALPNIAEDFRDLRDLYDAGKITDEPLDWMAAMKAQPPRPDYRLTQNQEETTAMIAGRYEAARRAALARAESRWRAERDVAWLAAALSLASPSDPEAKALSEAAASLPATSPAWLTAQYHLVRLGMGQAPSAQTRRRLDAILARSDLSTSDRNLFTAQRAQVASGLDDFLRYALRRRLCAHLNEDWNQEDRRPSCARGAWDGGGEVQPEGIYDGPKSQGVTGFGEDARATIDRMPLATRIALSRNPRLPRTLRLDVALTSYGRAVQLQDEGAIDALAGELADLLPLMAKDFRDVRASRRGPDKRFAELLVLAKIPGARTDLAAYVRPEGRRVADFQIYWTDWVILKRPAAAAAPPLALYQTTGDLPDRYGQPPWPDALTDLTCLDECGRGAAPLRVPDFVDRRKAAAERGFLFSTEHEYGKPAPAMPPGAVDAWDEMLDYAKAHPADPRVPEALHWLVHVGHFGGSHDHSGRRAFRLLHGRYEGSYWAKKTPYYND
ncbi:hypothetical protein [Phenylobacterium sp.]|uniref:hypothetical protein n=1 Tax=Phenylobacterium sp. TaxID=1871053 RepID=UPI002DEADB3F|nr:hypothetical protein [Phenylobacterium sp.]